MKRLLQIREAGTFALLVVVVLAAYLKDHRFLEPASINNILLWVPLLLVVGMGQMMVIVTRGIDVSVGSMLGFAGIVVGMLFKSHPDLNIYLGLAIGCGVGLALGLINGGLIALAKVPPIIATLGTLSAYRGFVFIVSKGDQVDGNYLPDGLTDWSMTGPLHLGGVTVPWLLVYAAVVALAVGAFLKYTVTGRNVFALGSNPDAAALRGIPVKRVLMIVYGVTGALSGIAGVLYASRYGFVNPGSVGQGFELTVIAAVVIGGTNVFGGSGSVLGVVLGSLLLACVSVALAVLGIAATWQLLVYGFVILLALILDGSLQRWMASRTEAA